jgi:enoyl-CoA hydratase/carnithine racemase
LGVLEQVSALTFMKTDAVGDVLIVTLDRADKRNALSAAFIEEIVTLFDWERRTEAVARLW